jgi:hypothetical protein
MRTLEQIRKERTEKEIKLLKKEIELLVIEESIISPVVKREKKEKIYIKEIEECLKIKKKLTSTELLKLTSLGKLNSARGCLTYYTNRMIESGKYPWLSKKMEKNQMVYEYI